MNTQQEFDFLITTTVKEEPEMVARKICSFLEEREIKLYAMVDHQKDMDALGVYSYPAFTILFGNPKVGSKLLEKLPIAAIDIPLRIAIVKSESGEGSLVIFRDMEHLMKEYIEQVEEIRHWAQEVNGILTNIITKSLG